MLAFSVAACGQAGDTAREPAAAAPLQLSEIVVAREEIVEPVYGTGTVTAHRTTDIGPRVSGIIEAIHVEVGDRVEEGAVLFQTRQVEYRIAVEQAEQAARLARAESEKARRDLGRVEKLHGKGVASEEQLDAARTSFEMADAKRGSAAAGLAKATQDLANTEVRAPYAGVITQRYVDQGAMMSTLMSSASLVVQLMKVDLVVAIVQIPEVHLRRVRVGTPARVRIDGTDREYESSVAVLNDRVDPLTRAFEVRFRIENLDHAIKPGLFARASLSPEAREVLTLERRVVLGPEGARHVFVAEGGRAVRRPVDVRELDATRVEILGGLSEGALVLGGPNLTQLAEGTSVRVGTAHADR